MARPALVNGTAGVIVGPEGKPFAVVGFTVARGRIVAIDLITNPDKFGGLARG
jgi:RNA polymerase sigma-70 factor (ECF subfamily)